MGHRNTLVWNRINTLAHYYAWTIYICTKLSLYKHFSLYRVLVLFLLVFSDSCGMAICPTCVTLRQNTPWYSDDLRSSKHLWRKAERKQRSTKLMVNHFIYIDRCQRRNKLLFTENIQLYYMKIVECGKNQTKFFRLTRNLIGNDTNVKLPSYILAE